MTNVNGHSYPFGNEGANSKSEVSDSWNMITGAAYAPRPLTLRINSYPLEIKEAFVADIPLR